MISVKWLLGGLLSLSYTGWAQKPVLVEMELMTYAEVYTAIHEQGKTTVLIDNGGTEQRGPHAVLGGHTIMARHDAAEIARRLGNALVAPVFPFSPTDAFVTSKWPGTISVPTDVYAKVNEAVIASMATAGFKNIIVMGDHGGGQQQLAEVARAMDAKYSPRGTRVYFSDAAYVKAQADFNAILKQRNLPISNHAGIPDTSSLMYLGGEAYVRSDKIVAGDPVLPAGQQRDPKTPLLDNGIQGDPRPSTPELGKIAIELRISNAVEQIRKLTGGK